MRPRRNFRSKNSQVITCLAEGNREGLRRSFKEPRQVPLRIRGARIVLAAPMLGFDRAGVGGELDLWS